eukprot:6484681-Amphidinium_carterae.1
MDHMGSVSGGGTQGHRFSNAACVSSCWCHESRCFSLGHLRSEAVRVAGRVRPFVESDRQRCAAKNWNIPGARICVEVGGETWEHSMTAGSSLDTTAKLVCCTGR